MSATQDREFFKTFAIIMVGLVIIGVLAAVVAIQVVSDAPNTNPLHSEAAVARGGAALVPPVQAAMKLTAKIMTALSYHG